MILDNCQGFESNVLKFEPDGKGRSENDMINDLSEFILFKEYFLKAFKTIKKCEGLLNKNLIKSGLLHIRKYYFQAESFIFVVYMEFALT